MSVWNKMIFSNLKATECYKRHNLYINGLDFFSINKQNKKQYCSCTFYLVNIANGCGEKKKKNTFIKLNISWLKSQ